MKCAVCLWMESEENHRDAITVCNGTAVCAGHLHLATSDSTVLIARKFELQGLEHYQKSDDELDEED